MSEENQTSPETPETPVQETETTAPTAAPAADTPAREERLRKTRVGVVVSDRMEKTITVEYIARVPHPSFNKIIKRSKKFYAHDEKGEAKVGDKVRIVETRPYSKLKRWRLVEVLAH